MSATPTVQSGRGQPIGPMDFNTFLEQPVVLFDEEGQTQQMTLHAAVVRGENITKGLDGRVKALNTLKYTEPATFNERQVEGQALLEQYDTLNLLVATVQGAVQDFKGMEKRYIRDLDKGITGSFPVMHYSDVLTIGNRFEQFLRTMQNSYLTGGTVNTYLADRVGVLKTNLDALKA